jgi:hypothetical protein
VACRSWLRVGQLTLRSSAVTSDRNRDARLSWTDLVTEPDFSLRPCWVGRGRAVRLPVSEGGFLRPPGGGAPAGPVWSDVWPLAGRMRALRRPPEGRRG